MPSPTQATGLPSAWHRFFFAFALLVTTGLLLLPWWRNHAILHDFYDYGLVIAGAGRMELGEHPYVDFLTPIQTLHFRLAVLAESVFGPHYLSLTYANAVFIAGSFLVMVALLFRALGAAAAIIVAAAVVSASSGQHTIVWHNALGVAWVTGVVWLAAQERFSRTPWWHIGLICALLYLGGMTKLTYQATALAFAGLFSIRDLWLGRRTWQATALILVSYLGFGILAPVATEIYTTGANWEQWYYNVIELPGSRLSMLKAMLSPGFFVKPAHDHYYPMFMPFVATWAFVLIVVVGAFAIRQVKAAQALRKRSSLLLILTAVGAWLCGAVAFVTNIEIAYLAGAIWLVLATGLALAWPCKDNARIGRATRITLCCASSILLVTSWISAWDGTRSLWSATRLERDKLVSTAGLPARYNYFAGMKITPLMWLSMEAFDLRLPELNNKGFKPSQFYFVNGTDWMVRAVPEARHRGLPLWLHRGTSYGEDESRVINHRLVVQDEMRVVVSLEAWNVWKDQTDWYLDKLYKRDRFGPLFNVYLARDDLAAPAQTPLMFALATGSSAYLGDVTATGSPLSLHFSPIGSFWGSEASFGFQFNSPVTQLQGRWIIRRIAAARRQPALFMWRATTTDADGTRKIIREEQLSLSARETELSVPFELKPEGRSISIEVELPPGKILEAGLREFHTQYLPDDGTSQAPRIDINLPGQPHNPAWAAALFARLPEKIIDIHGASIVVSPDQMNTGPELMVHTPGEVWFRIEDPKLKQLSGEFGLRPAAWTHSGALAGMIARVVFYRPGHIELLFEKTIRPGSNEADRTPQSFTVALPGEKGWIGLIFTSVNPPVNAHGQSWWKNLELK